MREIPYKTIVLVTAYHIIIHESIPKCLFMPKYNSWEFWKLETKDSMVCVSNMGMHKIIFNTCKHIYYYGVLLSAKYYGRKLYIFLF